MINCSPVLLKWLPADLDYKHFGLLFMADNKIGSQVINSVIKTNQYGICLIVFLCVI